MRGSEFAELTAFAAVAGQHSFAKAAAQLATAPSTLSQTIRGLEERLGVKLLNRTTRSVSLTEAGERLLTELQPALDSVARAVQSVNAFRDKPMGTLRLVMGRAVATSVFAPMIQPFLAAYPDITLEAISDDMRLDLVSNRFDAGLRIGELIERDMIAVRLIDRIRIICVASPAYVKKHGFPRTPHELQDHECIRHRWRYDDPVRPWPFEKDGERLEIAPAGRLTINEAQNVITAALNSIGIAQLPYGMVRNHIREKRLVVFLQDWATAYSGLYIYYPSRRQMPPPLAAFIDFARKAVSDGSYDPLPHTDEALAGE